jgi:hypothetical protein
MNGVRVATLAALSVTDPHHAELGDSVTICLVDFSR